MTLLIGVVMTLAAIAFVAQPFLRGQSPADLAKPENRSPSERDRLENQKYEALAAIKEAEFDYGMGKLSDADFNMLRDKFGAQALEAIAALDALQSGRHSGEPRRPTRIAYCPACGHTVPPRANFCPACGRSLKEAVA